MRRTGGSRRDRENGERLKECGMREREREGERERERERERGVGEQSVAYMNHHLE